MYTVLVYARTHAHTHLHTLKGTFGEYTQTHLELFP